MYRYSHFLLAAALLAASLPLAAQSTAAKPAATSASNSTLPSEATVNEFLKKMFGWNSNLTWKIAEIKPSEAPDIAEVAVVFNTPQGQQIARFYVTPDQKHALSGDIVPFGADPFAEASAVLKNVNGPVQGPKDAAVTIVEFADLECPACKAAQANVHQLMTDEPKAKLIFANFPLEQIHKWALLGAKYIDCLGRQNNDAVWKFIATTYEHQGEVNEQNAETMLKGYVKDSGGNPDEVAACAAKPDTEKRVRDSIAIGEKLNVTSTPTLFINGRKISGFNNTPYDMIKAMVDYDAK